jgi:hypothetical protein
MASGNTSKHRITGLISLLAILTLVFPLFVQPLRQLIFHAHSNIIRTLEPADGKLEKLVFTTEEFSRLNFTRPRKEFVYLDNMYDVQSITVSGNHVVVLALWDATESQMLLAMESNGKIDHSMTTSAGHIDFLPWFGSDRRDPHPVIPPSAPVVYRWIPVLYISPGGVIPALPPEFLSRS